MTEIDTKTTLKQWEQPHNWVQYKMTTQNMKEGAKKQSK